MLPDLTHISAFMAWNLFSSYYMCWNADVEGKLLGIEFNINSDRAWLCGLQLKRSCKCGGEAHRANNVSGVRTSQSWARPRLVPGARGLAKAQESPCPPGRHLLPGPDFSASPHATRVLTPGVAKAAGSVLGRTVLKTVCVAILMVVSVLNLLSQVRVPSGGSLELCQLRAGLTWEQRWETTCAGIFQITGLSTWYHWMEGICLTQKCQFFIEKREIATLWEPGDFFSLRYLLLFQFSLFFFAPLFICCVQGGHLYLWWKFYLILRFLIKSSPLFFYEKIKQANPVP